MRLSKRQRKQRQSSYWLYNKGKTNIVLDELGLTIKSGQSFDIFAHNPNLHWVQVRYSERYGGLKKFLEGGKLVRLSGPPPKEKVETLYAVSNDMIRDRSRSCVEIDPGEKDFIDQLEDEFMSETDELDESELARLNERFAESVDLDGFVADDFVSDLD